MSLFPSLDPEQIEAAAARVAGCIRVTPVIELEPRAFGSPALVTLKLELMQHTGSFKPRGAFNRILSAQVPEAGVIAASGGNHCAAVAYAARQLGHVAEIFVPEPTPDIKVDRLRRYGARVVLAGANCRAMEIAPDTPLVHAALACALARGGRAEEATDLIQLIEAHSIASPCPSLATAYLALGRRDRAIDVLVRARDVGSPQFVYVFVDPRLADLHGDPAFERLRPALGSRTDTAMKTARSS